MRTTAIKSQLDTKPVAAPTPAPSPVVPPAEPLSNDSVFGKQAPSSEPIDLTGIRDGDFATEDSKNLPPDGAQWKTIDANELKGKKTAPQRGAEQSPSKDEVEPVDGAPSPKKNGLEVSVDPEDAEPATEPSITTPAQQSVKKGRDYSQFADPADAEIASKLPNHLYERFAKITKQAREDAVKRAELQEQLDKAPAQRPAYEFEHPEAYKITPEWQQVVQAHDAYAYEENFWETQLERIKQGEPWEDLRGYDKDGNPQTVKMPAREDGKVDFRAETAVTRLFNRATANKENLLHKAHEIKNSHSARARKIKADRDQVIKQLFPTLDPSKYQGEDKKAYEDAQAALPKEFHHEVGSQAAFRLYVLVNQLARQLQKERAARNGAQKTTANLRRSGNIPVPSAAASDGDEAGLIDLTELRPTE